MAPCLMQTPMVRVRGNVVHSNFQPDAILWNGKPLRKGGNHLGSKSLRAAAEAQAQYAE